MSNVKLPEARYPLGANGPALFTEEQVRACVEANAAAKDAEIEALRAELIRVTNPDGSPNLRAEQSGAAESYRAAALHAIQKREQAEARAERLAEALRGIADIATGSRTVNSLPHIEKIARSALHPTAAQEGE